MAEVRRVPKGPPHSGQGPTYRRTLRTPSPRPTLSTGLLCGLAHRHTLCSGCSVNLLLPFACLQRQVTALPPVTRPSAHRHTVTTGLASRKPPEYFSVGGGGRSLRPLPSPGICQKQEGRERSSQVSGRVRGLCGLVPGVGSLFWGGLSTHVFPRNRSCCGVPKGGRSRRIRGAGLRLYAQKSVEHDWASYLRSSFSREGECLLIDAFSGWLVGFLSCAMGGESMGGRTGRGGPCARSSQRGLGGCHFWTRACGRRSEAVAAATNGKASWGSCRKIGEMDGLGGWLCRGRRNVGESLTSLIRRKLSVFAFPEETSVSVVGGWKASVQR